MACFKQHWTSLTFTVRMKKRQNIFYFISSNKCTKHSFISTLYIIMLCQNNCPFFNKLIYTFQKLYSNPIIKMTWNSRTIKSVMICQFAIIISKVYNYEQICLESKTQQERERKKDHWAEIGWMAVGGIHKESVGSLQHSRTRLAVPAVRNH